MQHIQYNNTFATASGPTGYRPPQVNAPTPAPVAQPQQRYEAKPDPEVYFLPDVANNSIPEDIRRQFQTDAYGRVLFFTVPPVDVEPKTKLGHTAKYLAWKAEREATLKEKRAKRASEEASLAQASQQSKRARSVELEQAMAKAKLEAVERLNDSLAEATVAEYKANFGEKWREALEMDLGALERGQDGVSRFNGEKGARERVKAEEERREARVKGLDGMLEFGVRT
jgi:chromatin structure-remodeling complex subunit RSC1/2